MESSSYPKKPSRQNSKTANIGSNCNNVKQILEQEEFCPLLQKFETIVHSFVTEFIELQIYDPAKSGIPKNYNLRLKIKLMNHILRKFPPNIRNILQEEVLATMCRIICNQRRIYTNSIRNEHLRYSATLPDIMYLYMGDSVKRFDEFIGKLKNDYVQRRDVAFRAQLADRDLLYDWQDYCSPDLCTYLASRPKSPRVVPDRHFEHVLHQIFKPDCCGGNNVYTAFPPPNFNKVLGSLNEELSKRPRTSYNVNEKPENKIKAGGDYFEYPGYLSDADRKLLECKVAARVKALRCATRAKLDTMDPGPTYKSMMLEEVAALQSFEESLLNYTMMSKCIPVVWCGNNAAGDPLFFTSEYTVHNKCGLCTPANAATFKRFPAGGPRGDGYLSGKECKDKKKKKRKKLKKKKELQATATVPEPETTESEVETSAKPSKHRRKKKKGKHKKKKHGSKKRKKGGASSSDMLVSDSSTSGTDGSKKKRRKKRGWKHPKPHPLLSVHSRYVKPKNLASRSRSRGNTPKGDKSKSDTKVSKKKSKRDVATGDKVSKQDKGTDGKGAGKDKGTDGKGTGKDTGTDGKGPGKDTGTDGKGPGKNAATEAKDKDGGKDTGTTAKDQGKDKGTDGKSKDGKDKSTQRDLFGKDKGIQKENQGKDKGNQGRASADDEGTQTGGAKNKKGRKGSATTDESTDDERKKGGKGGKGKKGSAGSDDTRPGTGKSGGRLSVDSKGRRKSSAERKWKTASSLAPYRHKNKELDRSQSKVSFHPDAKTQDRGSPKSRRRLRKGRSKSRKRMKTPSRYTSHLPRLEKKKSNSIFPRLPSVHSLNRPSIVGGTGNNKLPPIMAAMRAQKQGRSPSRDGRPSGDKGRLSRPSKAYRRKSSKKKKTFSAFVLRRFSKRPKKIYSNWMDQVKSNDAEPGVRNLYSVTETYTTTQVRQAKNSQPNPNPYELRSSQPARQSSAQLPRISNARKSCVNIIPVAKKKKSSEKPQFKLISTRTKAIPLDLNAPQENFFWVPLGRYSWDTRSIKVWKSQTTCTREEMGSREYMSIFPEINIKVPSSQARFTISESDVHRVLLESKKSMQEVREPATCSSCIICNTCCSCNCFK